MESWQELLKIPPFILKIMFFLARWNRALRPNLPYDAPFLPFNMRAGHKFLSEYDTDFSRATLDGDLSKGFSPEEALWWVKCPTLLMRADACRHQTWELIGALDDEDLERIVSLVDDLRCVQISSRDEIHMLQPVQNYNQTCQEGRLPNWTLARIGDQQAVGHIRDAPQLRRTDPQIELIDERA
jgi:hypothetical protein